MDNKKKESQLETVNKFTKALHAMRNSGVKLDFYQDGIIDKIVLVDRESGEQIGEVAMGEVFTKMTGQIMDESTLSTNYFGDLLEK